MNYKDLSGLIDHGLNAKSNYQYVVICHLVSQRGLKDIKENICNSLIKNNPGNKRQNGDLCDVVHYMSCPVWFVLKNKGLISIENKVVTLQIELTNDQRVKLSSQCKGYFK